MRMGLPGCRDGWRFSARSSGAGAIGPVLQGLNTPVNDLSRGALVEDIVNTVALTLVVRESYFIHGNFAVCDFQF